MLRAFGVFVLLAAPASFVMAAPNEDSNVAAQPRRLNILLAISDDQSHPHASAYGYEAVQTPAFDRIAREGVLFTNAFCASPGCSPSRAALLTGRPTWQLEHAGTHASSFSAKNADYPDLLDAAGYFVGYTGKGWGPGNWKIGGRARNPAGPAFNNRRLKKRPTSGVSNRDYAGNFADFLSQRQAGQPFCFWYGGHESHRAFEAGSALARGKKLAAVEVPPFLPDTPQIRGDLLDYFLEVEHFDTHLGRMIALLEEAGELDNTLIVVTSDNGMPFPAAKANCFEYGIHAPLAIRWPGAGRAGRTVNDRVGLVDLAPTFLDAAGLTPPSEMVGRSLKNIMQSQQAGQVDPRRVYAYSARERHSSSRYGNLAYPQRAIRGERYLLIRNFRPQRWPAGAPQKYDREGKLGPPHGGYHDIDSCPSLSFLIANRDDRISGPFFHLAIDKRPAVELYDIDQDPGCVRNLANDSKHAAERDRLWQSLNTYLLDTRDPRVLDGGDIFETYKRYSPLRSFPRPE